jgi:hypothetical protein
MNDFEDVCNCEALDELDERTAQCPACLALGNGPHCPEHRAEYRMLDGPFPGER